MKQILVILLILVSISFAFGQEISGYIEAQYIPIAIAEELGINNWHYDVTYGFYALNLMVMCDFHFLSVGGKVDTYILDLEKLITYYPFYTSYDFYAQANFGDFTLGYEHNCSHPVTGELQIGNIMEYQYAHDIFYVRMRF